jgi:hypothetical protein
MTIKSMSASDVLPLLTETLAAGQSVRLRVKGSSMRPLLLDGKTIVTIEPLTRVPNIGDVLLCRYGTGLILHRLIRIGDELTLRGDALYKTEDVPADQVLGVVTHYGTDTRTRPINNIPARLRVWLHRRYLDIRRLVRS